MVKHLITLLAIAGLLAASDLVLFNPTSYPVTNRVTGYRYSVNTPDYVGVPGVLIITNRAAQSDTGVRATNLTTACVVDGGWVRLTNAVEFTLIASNNAWSSSNSVWMAKYDAREFATNVVSGTDGLSLYLRAMGEANWWLLNNIRTNQGMPALTKGAYKTMIDTNIEAFGQ